MRIERWFYTVPLRLRSLFRRKKVEQELDDELRYHLERKIEKLGARGLTSEQARQAALRAMDGLAQRKEECRDARGVNALDNTVRDLRYSLRVLAKSPAFTVVAVVTLMLAIGANAVVFGVLNGLILRPLNVPRPESLYALERASTRLPPQSYPDYVDLRDRNHSFEALAAYKMGQAVVDTGENPSAAWLYEVSGNYFDALGIRPYLGRFFHASDEQGPNSAPYVVLTYAYWHSHFQDDRGVVGRTVQLNKHPFTLLGVAPPGFYGTLLFFSPSFFVPMVNQEQVDGQSFLNVRGSRSIYDSVFMAMGHLKAGVTPAQAVADLNGIGADLEKTYPKDDDKLRFILARPGLYGDFFTRPTQAFLLGLTLLAGLILLAACANLGSLFAARAADRSREIALQLALGSSRYRVLRGLFTEALLISLSGGAAGLWCSIALLRRLSAWQPLSTTPILLPVNPDSSVYAVALGLALVSGILFGTVPVRQALRTDPYQVIRSGLTQTTGQRITLRDMLLGAQIAICAVLVTSSMVAVRGLVRSLNANLGFEPRNAMLMDTVLNAAGYHGDLVPVMQRRIADAIEKIPGVTAVGLVGPLPPLINGGAIDTPVFAAETTEMNSAHAAAVSVVYSISPDYFRAAGTALLAGRAFTWHDDENAPRVAVINRNFARKVFGSEAKAMGGSYRMRDGTRIQVVGLVEDGKFRSLTEEPQAAMFFPLLQSPWREASLVVRSNRDPRQLAESIRSALHDLDRGLPATIQTWSQAMDLALFPARMATLSLGVLGAMGAMLSVTGIFGLAAYAVSKRKGELGIRVALGARRREVLQAALGRAFKLLGFGSAAGLILGVLASRVLAAIVYSATPGDPLVLAGAVGAMLLLGLLATWMPAQRALSLGPARLLREE